MVKMRLLKLTLTTLLLSAATFVNAGVLDFDSDVTISSTNKWTAGSDSTGQWYGQNFSVADGSAVLTETSHGNTRKVANSQNSIMIAFELSDDMIGSHSWSIDTLYNDYNTQYNYGQVYLLSDGQSVMLDKGIWGKKTGGNSIISKEYPRAGTGDMAWNTFGDTFDISQCSVSKYDYIAFVFTGSKHVNQELHFDNFDTTIYDASKSAVPEPATIAISSLGALMILKRRKTS